MFGLLCELGTVVDCFGTDATLEMSSLDLTVTATGDSSFVVAISGGSHALAEKYANYMRIGYKQKLVEHAIIKMKLLKPCLQKILSSAFNSLDPFCMTAFIVYRHRSAEHRDWMMSHSRLCRVIKAGGLKIPSLPETMANIFGVWPLIFSCLKETDKKDDGNSLVVK